MPSTGVQAGCRFTIDAFVRDPNGAGGRAAGRGDYLHSRTCRRDCYGQLLLRIAERLGVVDQAKAKSQVVAPGASVSMLAKDTSPGIVIALSVLTQIAGHPGAKLVGPLPKELQAPVTVFAALGAHPQG
jgi:hypothetical protein